MKGYVKKRKDGRWQGRIELPPDPVTGKRRQKYVYADKRQECQRLVNEIIYKLETSDFTDPGKLTVDAYLDEWFLTYCDKLANSTKQGYKNYIYNHISPHFKGFKIKSLKPIHIEEFYNLERKKYKEKTILQMHRILSKALRDAVKNNIIPKNPCEHITAPSPEEFIPSIPSIDIYYAILEAAKGTEHEIPVLLAGLCGLRREEVFGLTWNDIDFDNATLTIRQVVTTAEKSLDVKAPKTKKSARTISIPLNVLEVLEKQKSVGYIFSKDGKISNPGSYSQRFGNFLKSNNLPHIRYHDLRHFHATLLMEAGVPMKHAQNRMGHTTISMTAYYQHVLPKADLVVIEKIDSFLRGGQSGGQAPKKERLLRNKS